jgi:rubredoxin
MTAELDRYCPVCDADQSFYRVASTEVHIGTKVKWHCPKCDYKFVRIDGDVDTGAA